MCVCVRIDKARPGHSTIYQGYIHDIQESSGRKRATETRRPAKVVSKGVFRTGGVQEEGCAQPGCTKKRSKRLAIELAERAGRYGKVCEECSLWVYGWKEVDRGELSAAAAADHQIRGLPETPIKKGARKNMDTSV